MLDFHDAGYTFEEITCIREPTVPTTGASATTIREPSTSSDTANASTSTAAPSPSRGAIELMELGDDGNAEEDLPFWVDAEVPPKLKVIGSYYQNNRFKL